MNKPAQETPPQDEDALRKRLLGRIAVAAVVVVALLGSLAIFDALNTPVPAPPKMANVPPPEPEPPAPPATITTGPNAPDANLSATTPATVATAPGEPNPKAGPSVEPKSVPEHTASSGAPPLQPLPPGPRVTKPATGQSASIRPSTPVPPARPDTTPLTQPAFAARNPSPSTGPRGTPTRPLSEAAQAGRALPQPGEELPSDRFFALQMGVFSNVSNAEDLRVKLELAGIPSTIEARVHVGPFKTRAEADAARAKLKDLGLDGGLLITMKR